VNDVVGLISRVQNAYTRCIDSGTLESWPDFFEESCTYKITTRPTISRRVSRPA
jgi:3-phenylpropionate/cinnamic acid dioxygenase small subunit